MAETSKTAANALRLLYCFSLEKPVRTASDLARELSLSRTSVLRLLTALERFQFIERAPNGPGYCVGLKLFDRGALYLKSHPLEETWSRALDELVAGTQCTAYLGTLDTDEIVILGCKEGALPIRFIWNVGSRLPCTTTAIGKAILMHKTRDEIDHHIGKGQTLRRLTKNSLRTRAELDRELKIARKLGWATAREESHIGLTAVGAAILDEAGHPIGAVSVSLFDYPPDTDRIAHLGTVVGGLARRLSDQSRIYASYGAAPSQTVANAKRMLSGAPQKAIRRTAQRSRADESLASFSGFNTPRN